MHKNGSAYAARMSIASKTWNLGSYATEREARVAWDAAQVWRTVVNKTTGVLGDLIPHLLWHLSVHRILMPADMN